MPRQNVPDGGVAIVPMSKRIWSLYQLYGLSGHIETTFEFLGDVWSRLPHQVVYRAFAGRVWIPSRKSQDVYTMRT